MLKLLNHVQMNAKKEKRTFLIYGMFSFFSLVSTPNMYLLCLSTLLISDSYYDMHILMFTHKSLGYVYLVIYGLGTCLFILVNE